MLTLRLSYKLVEAHEIIEMNAKDVQCENSQEVDSSESSPDSQDAIDTNTREPHNLGNTTKTHLKKEEALGLQPTLQTQFNEKRNSPKFEPHVQKDSILRFSR